MLIVQETLDPGHPGGLELERADHSLLGAGLGIGLRVPIQGPMSSIERACIDLNRWIALRRIATVLPGAWCAIALPESGSEGDGDGSKIGMPVFRLFLPNCLYKPGLLGKLLPIFDRMPRLVQAFFVEHGYMKPEAIAWQD